MSEEYYQPDSFQFLLINNSIVKVFAAWSGSYLSGDAYRVNSGTESIVEKECHYLVYGFSGSVYKLRKCNGHINHYCRGILNKIIEESGVQQITPEQAIEFLKENK